MMPRNAQSGSIMDTIFKKQCAFDGESRTVINGRCSTFWGFCVQSEGATLAMGIWVYYKHCFGLAKSKGESLSGEHGWFKAHFLSSKKFFFSFF